MTAIKDENGNYIDIDKGEVHVDKNENIEIKNNESKQKNNETTNKTPGFTSIIVLLGVLFSLIIKRL